MNNPLVSIIVPVYNREYSLHKCLDSILSQTHKNLELICVDDGSTDKSPEICDEYAKKDNRVRVVHIPNGGVSNARNTGIDMAQGEYIFFVDSDDYVEPEHLENLIPTNGEDLVFCGFKRVKNKKIVEINTYKNETIEFSKLENIEIFLFSFPCFSCMSCYKKNILNTYNIRFNKGISISEDQLFSLEYLIRCNKIKSIDKCTYCYCFFKEESLVTSYHHNILEVYKKISLQQEKIAGTNSYILRWYNWNIAINHYNKWIEKGDNETSKQAKRMLKVTYKDHYFRESISYIRKNGSLDQKFETYFMNYYLHPLYKPTYKIIEILSKFKNHK